MLQKNRKEFANLILVVSLAFFFGGCALGVTRLKITHDPLDCLENKKEGNILVKQFVDKRKEPKYIGNKRNIFGMVLGHIGTEEGVKLEALLTDYFAKALKEAGYNAIIQWAPPSGISRQVKFDAIVDGEILEFWMDLYVAVWHKVEVKVKAIDPANKNVLWEKDIRGYEKNVLWFGVTSEYENVIRQALTKALNQAVKEFSSDEFYKVIKN